MTPDPSPDRAEQPAVEMVLREQQLNVELARRPYERVVLRRRVVTETRQVEVTVQREELEVLRLPVEDSDAVPPTTAPTSASPVVIVLSEQVPVIELLTRAYEQVTVTVEQVTAQQTVTGQVSREHAHLDPQPGQASS